MRRTAYRKSQGLAKHVSQTIGSTKCLVDFGKKTSSEDQILEKEVWIRIGSTKR